jgi:hypothetical protein
LTDFDRIARLGGYADALRNDENFKDVLRGLKDDAIRGWADSKSTDQREDFWRDLQAVGRLENKLRTLGETYRAELTQRKSEQLKRDRANYREAVDRA